MTRRKAILVWLGVAMVLVVPVGVAAMSPLLAWRSPVYILAGFAGVIAMALLLMQPLLAGGYLPGLPVRRGRQVHRVTGIALVAAVLLHVAGLWVTSPPDVVDALTFTAPTLFSAWGVIAMWAVFAAAILAVMRPLLRPRLWRLGHTAAVLIVVVASVSHAVLIEGTMGTVSKAVLCVTVLAATAKVMSDLRVWRLVLRPPGVSRPR